MKPFISLILLFSLLQLAPPVTAQAPQQGIEPLQIGDTLPPLSLEQVLNHPEGRISLDDYRGRWLILDFWATWCGPCISMFPKADSLERQFAGKLAFLPVTYEGEEVVKTAFEKRKALQGLRPALVTGDGYLRYLFPHEQLPHYVWIDPSGVVRAITGPEEINEMQIGAVLEQAEAASSLPQKAENSLSFDRYDPLVVLNPLLPQQTEHYSSALTGYQEGVSSFSAYEPPGPEKAGRFIAANFSLLSLFRTVYSTDGIHYGLNRVVYEVADQSPLAHFGWGAEYEVWLRSGGGHCYELRLPPHLGGSIWDLVRKDLDRLFPHYQARVKMRRHTVMALVRLKGKEEAFRSGGGSSKVTVTPYGARLEHAPLDKLLAWLNVRYLYSAPGPLINRTGYDGPVNLDFEAEMTDLQAVRTALQAYGLDLVERKEKIKVLVVRDVPATTGKKRIKR